MGFVRLAGPSRMGTRLHAYPTSAYADSLRKKLFAFLSYGDRSQPGRFARQSAEGRGVHTHVELVRFVGRRAIRPVSIVGQLGSVRHKARNACVRDVFASPRNALRGQITLFARKSERFRRYA